MRLVDLSNLGLGNFPANEIPDYAIIFYTWGEDKVLFADVGKGINNGKKAEYEKI